MSTEVELQNLRKENEILRKALEYYRTAMISGVSLGAVAREALKQAELLRGG